MNLSLKISENKLFPCLKCRGQDSERRDNKDISLRVDDYLYEDNLITRKSDVSYAKGECPCCGEVIREVQVILFDPGRCEPIIITDQDNLIKEFEDKNDFIIYDNEVPVGNLTLYRKAATNENSLIPKEGFIADIVSASIYHKDARYVDLERISLEIINLIEKNVLRKYC